jgi:hypothetical protein
VDCATSTGKTFDVNQLLMVMVSLNSVEGTRSVAQEYRLIMFDNGVRVQIFGYERVEAIGRWRNFIMKNFTMFTVHIILVFLG